MLRTFMGALLILALAAAPAVAEEEGIMDNSFLVEEAYNQEPGVVQHIQTFQTMRDRSWGYSFTQEWPLGTQDHQFSYTIPVLHTPDPSATGVGDIGLNYRYQAVLDGTTAFSPRLSLLLPTGDVACGFGANSLALQVNLPVSVRLSDSWETHWNAGATYTPRSQEPGGDRAPTLGYNLGSSFVYHASPNFNLLLETVYTSTQVVEPGGTLGRGESLFLNPGMRFAINCDGGLQVVPGIAFPIGLGPSEGESGVFFYLSFEHPFEGD